MHFLCYWRSSPDSGIFLCPSPVDPGVDDLSLLALEIRRGQMHASPIQQLARKLKPGKETHPN